MGIYGANVGSLWFFLGMGINNHEVCHDCDIFCEVKWGRYHHICFFLHWRFLCLTEECTTGESNLAVSFGSTVTHLLFADDGIAFWRDLAATVLHYGISWVGMKWHRDKKSSSKNHTSSLVRPTRKWLKHTKTWGISSETPSERYLGLPTVVDRSKEST